MLVTFISQCEKKALKRTRRVLDAFAERIGDCTWQTLITEDGLLMIKKLLRQTATKSTAVACHWRRGRNRSELVWIVGNRKQFNAEGIVPVNRTQKSILKNNWENSWLHLPLIKALVALAALLHDWGKATQLFQDKLKNNRKEGDPLRHEWISCLLLHALVQQSGNNDTDEAWLELLAKGSLDESSLKKTLEKEDINPLKKLPPIASMVAWLIVTHHRLPFLRECSDYHEYAINKIDKMLGNITASWGYENKYDEKSYQERVKDCFKFPHGLLSQSNLWVKQVKKWSARLLQQKEQAQQVLENGCWRIILQHARLCLMLGDHYYSSCDADKNWQSTIDLFANTDKEKKRKQKLDEHLVHVCKNALNVCQSLSRFSNEMDFAQDVPSLKQKSPQGYEWQDQAVEKISQFRAKNTTLDEKGHGWFVINIASTGCGKTIANAKIMRALSADGNSLRYILALGLRTLTLQTGDEYRHRIGLTNQDLAVLIGSAAVKALHEGADKNKDNFHENETNDEFTGSESIESILDEDVDFEQAITMPDFLNAIIPEKNYHKAKKNKAFLYAPVLACTIDHIMAATETIRGGKYILPYLRLLSSDLVIDEVDDFDGKDLIAIGRLVHLAGMLGRKVMLSSATIPPALAEGFFNAYQAGWRLHSQFHSVHSQIACAWIDEFNTQVDFVAGETAEECCSSYQQQHRVFINARVKNLQSQLVRRKGKIIYCKHLLDIKDDNEREKQYFEIIKQAAIEMHARHAIFDPATGKTVSFGVIRMANIPPCVSLFKYLLKCDWPEGYAPKIMAYHSRQILLLRHLQEQHLEEVLKRKEKPGEIPKVFDHPLIREHLNNTNESNILFIVVATPVEEIGRDHDFDWAIVEPSSYRSIIQLVGRVRRHRLEVEEITQPNIAIMQYNLRALRAPHRIENKKNDPVFCRPGYENGKFRLSTHDVSKLINTEEITQNINAIPRIYQQDNVLDFKNKLIDLEHQVLSDCLKNYHVKGPDVLQGWLTECWWLTALPQKINSFRESSPNISLYLIYENERLKFYEKNNIGEWVCRDDYYKMKKDEIDCDPKRLWLLRDYQIDLRDKVIKDNNSDNLTDSDMEKIMERYSKLYGEITIPAYYDGKQLFYSNQFGLCIDN